MDWLIASVLAWVLEAPSLAVRAAAALFGTRTSSGTRSAARSGIAGARPSSAEPRSSSVGHGTSKLLVQTRTGPSGTLVGQAPHRVTRGTYLTDGADLYEVLDIADRPNGRGRWIQLENVKFVGKAEWFRLSDCGPLAIVDRNKRQRTTAVRG